MIVIIIQDTDFFELSRFISRVLYQSDQSQFDDGHSSRIHVTMNFKQSTRPLINANNISEPIRSCTKWGLQIP